MKHHHSKFFFFTLAIGSIFFLAGIIFLYSTKVNALSLSERLARENVEHVLKSIPNKQTEKKTINGKAYIIYDIKDKKTLSGKNEKAVLPMASLTKVITVGTFLNTAKEKNIPIREETKLKMQKALIQSSNMDADNLGGIYNFSFGGELLSDSNKLVSELGINDVLLTNLTGLDNYDGSPSNVGSAESMAKIFAYMYENFNEVFEYTKFDELDTGLEKIRNTNQSSRNTFGILASKTGYTFAAGGNLGVIVSPEPGTTYVVIVMGSTKEGRFQDVRTILEDLPLIVP